MATPLLPWPLTLGVLLGLLPACACAGPSPDAGVASFDPDFFRAGGQLRGDVAVDVSRFAYADTVAPGIHDSNVRRNGEWIGRLRLEFAAVAGLRGGQLCLDAELLQRLGVGVDRILQARESGADAATLEDIVMRAQQVCGPVDRVIPGAVLQVDNAGLDVDIAIPHAWLLPVQDRSMDETHWDAGMPAMLLGHTSNLHRQWRAGHAQTTLFSGLTAGINAGAWRLRHTGSLAWSSAEPLDYTAEQTWLGRDVPRWRSQLSLGELVTPGDVFDSMAMRGLLLHSDEQMLPDALQGYAPVVRGIAQTSARVSIRQRGRVLREISVAPGPFLIDDLRPTAGGGDLLVTVHESDGREQVFHVPHASVPHLLRAGQSRHMLAVGQARAPVHAGTAMPMVLATLHHGVGDGVTTYAGMAVVRGYHAVQLGAAVATALGAVAIDVTRSRMHPHAGEQTESADGTGYSTRLRYSRTLTAAGTNIAVGAYRYSTAAYVEPAAWVDLHGRRARSAIDMWQVRPRRRIELTLSQQLGQRGGAVQATVFQSSYWERRGSDLEYMVGYGYHWRGVSLTINAQRTRMRDAQNGRRSDSAVTVSMGIPLGGAHRAPRLTLSAGHADHWRGQLGVTGVAGERLGYTGSVMSAERGAAPTVAANIAWAGPVADAVAGASHGARASTVSVGATGLLVGHAHGVTAGRGAVNEAIALVEAPGAHGARLPNGARINRQGYALEANLSPYRFNAVTLDLLGSHPGVQLDVGSQEVIPRRGAVVSVPFASRIERTRMFAALREDGRVVPFGATVHDADGQVHGVVGQRGRVLLRGDIAGFSVLDARWGAQQTGACRLQVPDGPDMDGTSAAMERLPVVTCRALERE